jgi:hypothetical protein
MREHKVNKQKVVDLGEKIVLDKERCILCSRCVRFTQEVSKTGTGFMLIKRHVFEKLNAHPAVRSFVNDIGLPAELNPYMKTYFDTAVRENRYYSEDWTFCENWRDLGGKVWVDKRVLLKHTGTYVFDYAAQDRVYQELHALALQNGTGVAAPVNVTAAEAVETPVKTRVLASSKKTTAKATVSKAKATVSKAKVKADPEKKTKSRAK